MNAAIAMNAKNRRRPADTRPADSAPILIETISATRAPPSRYRPIQHPFFKPPQKKSGLDERREGAHISRLPGVRRTITSMAMREIKSDISFANAVGHTQRG
ncbi:hypothetical protein [Mesorhizobium sp. AR10]|uniref:hypothetical protein n=1 Tax=Mesorhizobium sp. AR10 TaxID=2865839 RepID=UPI00215F14D1|nr:hypothetical protein [Mesorhizobium sp. AR10]